MLNFFSSSLFVTAPEKKNPGARPSGDGSCESDEAGQRKLSSELCDVHLESGSSDSDDDSGESLSSP